MCFSAAQLWRQHGHQQPAAGAVPPGAWRQHPGVAGRHGGAPRRELLQGRHLHQPSHQSHWEGKNMETPAEQALLGEFSNQGYIEGICNHRQINPSRRQGILEGFKRELQILFPGNQWFLNNTSSEIIISIINFITEISLDVTVWKL